MQPRRVQTTPEPEIEIEIRPDGTVLRPSRGSAVETILPSELDALRLITRGEPEWDAELSLPNTYRIRIGDRRPVFGQIPGPDGMSSAQPELSAIGIIAESAF